MGKKITMLDIANKAGVSKATVSMVINKTDNKISEETRKKILNIAKELNYIPNSIARSLSTNKSNTIGIILPDITNPFFAEIARAIEDEASENGYNVIFCNTDNVIEKEEKYTKLLISKLIDGVIFISGGDSSKSIKILEDNNIHFILVDRYIESYYKYYGVYCLNEKGVKEGIEYLYSKNNKKIAFVSGPKEIQVSMQRLKGYKETMTKYGIYKNNLVFEGDFTINGGKKATEEILKINEKVDAIFYSNDMMAYGGMKVLVKKGYKIPKDISIMGFDNINISKFIEPELTTVGQPIYSMGKNSCNLLIKLINNENIDKRQIYFETKLIIRDTVSMTP
ncbi:HTH-type transcriptional repressor CytR [Clostridium acetireducens DSM 10703]|jgi:LacI family transcriptional regulator|uniref:HTH-type transcriptional repressor CytR n=1 Tax=Clostridium acetireducens DSM 10703 TaxID=1121290 RepID=A0A1E8EW68_9CLOT|nr:LacI family DNA-binding transcriptional regulator [Clostridium acetireducens]OFI01502.1 HTH-type transcriptional repressor CytR [Clostridium acetireducens DSM 10703]